MTDRLLKNIDLNGHSYEIDAKYLGGKDISDIENCVKITYAELKSLRDSSKLIPGKQYRIIDYITSTTQLNTKSAGHQFDIIVTADDVNRLNEKARAIQHEGDTYFKDSNLSAWEIWYCLDNDTNRFSWASNATEDTIKDYQIGKICGSSDTTATGTYTFTTPIKYIVHKGMTIQLEIGTRVSVNEGPYVYATLNNNYEILIEDLSTGYTFVYPIFVYTDPYVEYSGRGVIYRMIDEFNNDCPYDFKNIQFARWELSNPVGYRNDFDVENESDNWIIKSTPFDSLKTGFYGLNDSTKVFRYAYKNGKDNYEYKVEYTISESTYCYTFGKDTDYSISGGSYKNVIKKYTDVNKMSLNNIVFLGDYCCYNSFGNDCRSNSFGDFCRSNSFGNDCYSNSFGNDCDSNSFSNGCSSNSFSNCSSNSFGEYCYSNSFGNDCHYNSFGNGCHYNSFGTDCDSNSFGNGCSRNSFGNYCSYNSFGNDCYYNSFGNDCDSNSFGNGCSRNSFGNDCDSNSFGNNCGNITFSTDCSGNSFGNECRDITLSNSYMSYNTFGDKVTSLVLTTSSTASSSQQVQYYRFATGATGSAVTGTITAIRGRSYETYVGRNSDGTIKQICLFDK